MARTSPFQDEGLLRRIEANDPNIHSMCISSEDTVAVSYEEFDRFGRALANNTSIKELGLRVPNPEDNVDLAGWLRLLGLIGQNRSIKSFHYASYRTAERPLRVISAMNLKQFFERNGALESVSFDNLDHEEAEEFASALASRETALKSITIYGATSIEILRLIFEEKPAAIPKEISARHIGNEGAEALALFLELANVVGICELNINADAIGWRGLQRIARALEGRDSPLDSLRISSSLDSFLVSFAVAFLENPDLLPNEITLSGDRMCEAGGHALGLLLVKRGTQLENLFLIARNEDERLGVLGVVDLLQVLCDNPSKTPKSLNFHRFHNVLMKPIEELLRNRMCSMEEINFHEIRLHPIFYRRITSICCNQTSINATYHSNHTLIKVGHACPQLKHYLAMNRDPDKEKVARIKVYDSYFAHDFQPDLFVDMQPSLLSEVLPFVNQAFADHEVFTSEAASNGNEATKQATNNSLSVHFMVLKDHPSLLSNLLGNRH